MSIRALFRFAPLVLALPFAIGAARAECDKTLRVASSDYPPYIYKDASGKWAGLDVELMQAIFKEADCSYRFAPLVAPKRMVEMVSSGQTDIMLAASDAAERRRANVFGPVYRYETVSLVGLAGKVGAFRDVKDFHSLKATGARLLLPNAGFFGDDYNRMLPSLRAADQVVEFTYLDQGIRMLAAGRGALMMSDTGAIFAAAKRERVAIEAIPFTVTRAPIHMMFSRASVSEHDVKQLSEATLRLEKRGVLQTIRSAYGLR
ncbi:ABC transporter substrate-binding protein [Massilia sp. TS11]|uniref:substrate-binding periplasmic protein n=1 Tax=Massilia sp. TS11 TaxID=2908003 RepID=UPI001ED9EE4E|nr:transporter substrate-binding domain-containing protein [Massilia sp. TS11]MCG2583170.1 transporter substrate-binding domain-containing protein [Massilia sp. TS11]